MHKENLKQTFVPHKNNSTDHKRSEREWKPFKKTKQKISITITKKVLIFITIATNEFLLNFDYKLLRKNGEI